MTKQLFSTLQGMATLTSAGVDVFHALEDLFLSWASRCNAAELRYPSLIRVEDLASLRYFHNFPQLVMCACTLDATARSRYSTRGATEPIAAIPAGDLRDPQYCLPPAACYNVYLGLRGTRLNSAQYFTTVANCFRNEDHFRGLERLRGFTMREIVCVGSAEAVEAHLSAHRSLLQAFMASLDLPVIFERASDPFFDKDSVDARASRIFPTKEELVYNDRLAIGSVNYHRQFFGKLCNISVADQPASTGCVAFGIERWIHALAERFGKEPQRIAAVLEAARQDATASLATRPPMRAAGA